MRLIRTVLVATLLLTAVVTATAQSEEPASALPAPDAGATAAVADTAPDTTMPLAMVRDPFWPVGWLPSASEPDEAGGRTRVAEDDWAEARKLIRLVGISKTGGSGYAAVLKDVGVVEVGDVVAVTYNGVTYKWKIRAITNEGIVPERAGSFRAR